MEEVKTAVQEAVKAVYNLAIEPEVNFADPKFGDFATNVALKLSKKLQQSPQKIATRLLEAINKDNIQKIEIAGAGFINIEMTSQYWQQVLNTINTNYLNNGLNKGKKIQVEFISANPTGPFTLGNARGGFVGDVLANVLAASGAKVTREYYFNDAGTQIKELLKSVRASGGMSIDGETQYRGEYINDLAKRFNTILATDDNTLAHQLTADIFQNHIEPALEAMGITFDEFFNEGTLSEQFGDLKVLLSREELLEEKAGALWLRSSSYGDDRDRVLIKTSGDITYLGNDIAYHSQIFSIRKFDKAIKVWGADHAGQVPSLQLTIKRLFPEKELDFVIVQWVRLIRGGKEFKISKRAGTFVTVEELIQEVGTEVARFFMLMRSNDTHMDFDLDLAKEQSQKNPFYYVMYAYVRANSIISQAKAKGLKPGKAITALESEEKEIIRQLAQLPQLVENLSSTYEVHKLTFYGIELARRFHDYYEQTRIIDLPQPQAAEKLYFLQQFVTAMQSYWQILGIDPREKM